MWANIITAYSLLAQMHKDQLQKAVFFTTHLNINVDNLLTVNDVTS